MRFFNPSRLLSESSPLPVNAGILYAVLAYGAWGMFPLYWKLFGQTPAVEVLSHRVVWSMVFLIGLIVVQRRGGELAAVVRSPTTLTMLLTSALLLTVNWGIYIYGVNSDRVVETSLGYFINPLVTVLLGALFLKERLSRWQWAAVGLAAVGVTYFVGQFGAVPWIALSLACTFALYGLLRKLAPVAPLLGLAVETLMMTPLALGAIAHWSLAGTSNFTASPGLTAVFIGAGLITSMPLLWFNNAAKRLPLSTLGFFQYIAPSLQLMLGVFLYGEAFTLTHALTFGCIWTALLLYSTHSWMLANRHA
ncbi:MAG: EamA family transporter RarD [Kaiparowitsia implicata GSE-PSE-MK54-09C]|jgi:chloramphenicol-sensitive protein RarD|nr:EamA family transporter RarD [Kaiparowitsia implicata GSE-PSE-MK54-09C]